MVGSRGSHNTKVEMILNILPHGLLLLLCSLCLGSAGAEYYSSVDSLEMLGLMEEKLLNDTRVYLKQQQQQLDTYHKFLTHITLQHELALKQSDAFLGDPLQAFALLKRLVNDWNEVHVLLLAKEPVEKYRKVVDSLHAELPYPDQQELRGAAKGFMRLQDLYNLSAVDLANGYVNDEYFDAQLNWPECLEMAVQLYELQQYKLATDWLQVTASLLEELPDAQLQTKQQLLAEVNEYFALIYHEQHNRSAAVEMLNTIPQLDATHAIQHTLSYVQQLKATVQYELVRHTWYANYTRLCQGKPVETPAQSKPALHCYLDSKRHARFVLAPLKVELIHVDPDINVYHGLLNDEQIDQITAESEQIGTFRSKVGSTESRVDDVRVSQQNWLDYKSRVMSSIKQLVSAISGFNMNNSEYMQVANYGMGGQYEPHLDALGTPVMKDYLGDRISTSMFYLSDVERGGYTVFTKLNVFLPPIKGAMVMWHNLHRSLDLDKRTIHAGCPVIMGSKKIGNIWIHSGLQDIHRPCDLQSDTYKSQNFDAE